MEKASRLNGILEIYNASGEFDIIAGEKIEIEIAGEKEFEETCPADKKCKIRISIEILERAA